LYKRGHACLKQLVILQHEEFGNFENDLMSIVNGGGGWFFGLNTKGIEGGVAKLKRKVVSELMEIVSLRYGWDWA
jgi:hypothetical protein